jgi:predicted AAA+ superfamily ATPase
LDGISFKESQIEKSSATKFHIERKARPIIETALADTRVVLISGPRQAGKTTLARKFANARRPYITLDDVGTLSAAKSDPTGFVLGIDRAVIDEIQRAPDLMLAIKESVDRNEEPSRFLLTGSANLATIPAVADSLAGRMAVVPLLPFAQSEIRSTSGQLLDRLFDGDEPTVGEEAVFGDGLMEIVLKGGYPEALHARRRRAEQPGLRIISLSFSIGTFVILQISTSSTSCRNY